MKLINCTLFFCIFITALLAQNPSRPGYKAQSDSILSIPKKDVEAVVEDKLSRLDLIGFHFEKSYSKKNTIVFSAYAEFLHPYFDDGSPRLTYGLLPKIELSNRHYYSLEKRKKIGKPYQYNTGTYVSGKLEVQQMFARFQPDFYNYTTALAGVLWGYQNNVEPITFNAEIGLGVGFLNIDTPNAPHFEGVAVAILTKLKFGFLLNKQK